MEKKNPESRFPKFGQSGDDNSKASRILYIVIVAVLCISAVIVGLVSALSRSQEPEEQPSESESASESESGSEQESDSTTPSGGEVEEPDDPTVDANKIPDMIAPTVGLVTNPYEMSIPVYNPTMGDYRVHDGIDVAASLGAEVVAVADGEVIEVSEDPMMGVTVKLSMNGNAVAVYQNLGDVAEGIAVGTKISSGDVIASVGESALLECAEEPHLHFSLLVNGAPVNPMDYFTEEAISTSLSTDTSYEG